jgi:predicted hydrocarbon binding protein
VNGKGCGGRDASRNDGAAKVGGLSAAEFASLDELAVKLSAIDAAFAAPLEAIGRALGSRIATQHGRQPLAFDDALPDLFLACGFQDVIQWRFLDQRPDGARLQISGCADALGWDIPQLGRAVCGFDAALMEGFLRGITGVASWTVKEVACLGLGNTACEFIIRSGHGGPDGAL